VAFPIDLARQELAAGVKEPDAYARYSGGRDEAWCAHFVSWLFRTAGAPLPGSVVPGPGVWSPTAGCNFIVKTMKEAGRLLPSGAIPQANDLIFYKHVDPKTGAFESPGLYGLPFIYGHVGLVEGVVDEGGVKKVVTIEGNYSNKVARVKTRLDSPTIGCFARPVGAVKSAVELQRELASLRESETALVASAAKAPTEASRAALQTVIDRVHKQIVDLQAQLDAIGGSGGFSSPVPVGPILFVGAAAALAFFALKRRS
jgi:hypothetical protein